MKTKRRHQIRRKVRARTRARKGGYYTSVTGCPYVNGNRKDPNCVEIYNVPTAAVRGVGTAAYTMGDGLYQGVRGLTGYSRPPPPSPGYVRVEPKYQITERPTSAAQYRTMNAIRDSRKYGRGGNKTRKNRA